jgi:hypothetical protein
VAAGFWGRRRRGVGEVGWLVVGRGVGWRVGVVEGLALGSEGHLEVVYQGGDIDVS